MSIIIDLAVLVVALITIPFEIAPDGQRPDTQEHTDLRLEDLRVQLESLRKALKE
jgi:hypothetical protein